MINKMKSYLSILLLLTFIMLSGCQTTKGIVSGFGQALEGLPKDVESFVNAIKMADNWIDKNLW